MKVEEFTRLREIPVIRYGREIMRVDYSFYNGIWGDKLMELER